LPLFPEPPDGQLLAWKIHIAFDGLKHGGRQCSYREW
jgi:hypothetical protein